MALFTLLQLYLDIVFIDIIGFALKGTHITLVQGGKITKIAPFFPLATGCMSLTAQDTPNCRKEGFAQHELNYTILKWFFSKI